MQDLGYGAVHGPAGSIGEAGSASAFRISSVKDAGEGTRRRPALSASDAETFATTLRSRRARQKSALPPLRWLPRIQRGKNGEETLIGAQVDMSQLWLSVPRRTMRRGKRKSLVQQQREFDAELLKAACVQAATWPENTRLLVTLEDDQAPDTDFNARLAEILKETGFPFSRLDLAFQEAGLGQDDQEICYTLSALRDQGSRIFMAGLGTPPSSLAILRERGINGLLDGVQFDVSLLTASPLTWAPDGNVDILDPGAVAFYRAVLEAVASVNLQVRAIGVDTPELLEFARNVGCAEMSGAVLAPAETASQIAERFDAMSGRPRRRRMSRTTEGL